MTEDKALPRRPRHSHPGNSAIPSRQDFEHLHWCLMVASALEITVVDDVIISRTGAFYSARECGLLEPDTVKLATSWQREREAERMPQQLSVRTRLRRVYSLARLFWAASQNR
jgi:hypothetical protein